MPVHYDPSRDPRLLDVRPDPSTPKIKPRPPHKKRRSMRQLDTSQLLEATLPDEVEYIRGEGRVVHHRPQPPEPPPRTPPPTRTDVLSLFLDEQHFTTSGSITWDQSTNRLIFLHHGNSVTFPAQNIQRVDYTLGTARFVFSTASEYNKPPLLMFGLRNREIGYAMRFRSMITNVFPVATPRTEENIDKKEADLRRRYEKKRELEHGQDAQKKQAGTPPASRRAYKQSQAKRSLPRRNALQQPRFRKLLTGVKTTAAPEQSLANTSKDAIPECIKAGDRVFRMREACHYDDGRSGFDENDLYDGPFVVNSVMESQHTSGRQSGEVTDTASDREARAKLESHPDAKADPWVSLRRLRKAYAVPAGSVYESNKEEFEAALAAAAVDSPSLAIPGQCFAAKLSSSIYVTGNLADPDFHGNGLFEIDRLRRKRIAVRMRRDFPNVPNDDGELKKWLEESSPLPSDHVLVVQYLVHWAGWPSEDDTWETAYRNIPDALIEAFHSNNQQDTILPD